MTKLTKMLIRQGGGGIEANENCVGSQKEIDIVNSREENKNVDTPDKNVSGSGTSASDDVKLNKAHKKITQLKLMRKTTFI